MLAVDGIQVAIHFHLHQVRGNGLNGAVNERGDEREQRHAPVRAKVFDQSPHQSRVVRFTDNFFVVGTHVSFSNASSINCLL